MRTFLKSIALAFPPVRRVYDSLLQANQARHEQMVRIFELEQRLATAEQRIAVSHDEYQQRVANLRSELDETTEYMHRARKELAKTGDLVWDERSRADGAEARCVAIESEKEALELQLYVLRSDLQRAAARNESLVHEVRRFESEARRRDAETVALASLADQSATTAAERVLGSLRPVLEKVNDRLSR